MIEKERLEELIEQGATIYEVKYGSINPVDLKNKIKLINYKYGMISFEPRKDEKYLSHKYFKNLFETKEEAEWQLEFGNITRTETLTLPTWEEIQIPNLCINFIDKDWVEYEFFNSTYNGISTIGIKKTEEFFCEYEWDLSKENYIIACRKAKELFLG